jgi:hypothetical protein
MRPTNVMPRHDIRGEADVIGKAYAGRPARYSRRPMKANCHCGVALHLVLTFATPMRRRKEQAQAPLTSQRRCTRSAC